MRHIIRDIFSTNCPEPPDLSW